MKALAVLTLTAMSAAQGASDLSRLIPVNRAGMVVSVRSTTTEDGVVVDDVRAGGFEAPDVEAYVVRPASPSRTCAGILFVHWFAPPDPTSNRTQFLAEAKEWARRGVVSVLPTTFWASDERYKARTWQTDFTNSIRQAAELRYAHEILLRQPCVDRSRVAIVGHDYGAMFGSLVAAAEPDVKAVVLIAGVPKFSSWYQFGTSTGVPKGDDLTKYRADLARIDPGYAVSLIKAPILFQFGTKDRYTPKAQIDAFIAAATGPKETKLYDSGHDMTLPEIRRDRMAWLASQLGLK